MQREWTSPIRMEQEHAEEMVSICTEILYNVRNELYLNMRFLDISLSSLRFIANFEEQGAGTDGFSFFYQPEYLISCYQNGRFLINRLYLHSIFHCLFCHMDNRKKRKKEFWDLACDIADEWILDHLNIKCIHIPFSAFRREFYLRMQESIQVVTAESVYDYLKKEDLNPQRYARLVEEFKKDHHGHWEDSDHSPKISIERKNKWEKNREEMQTEMETFSKEASKDSKKLYDALKIENRQHYDYREFLRKFAVLKETMQLDTDAFDYIYYHYGMENYGNMPFIEPLETKEAKRIEDFVIVIDTSMSCSETLVKRFLEETYQILSESETFFTKVNVHIIQCDEQVQNDQIITDLEGLFKYMENCTICGKGGTDFRPAFAYVDALLNKQAFHKLKGLIYFTDGYGIFPVKMPSYDTAFVFLKKDYNDVDVPSWAMKLILEEDDLNE